MEKRIFSDYLQISKDDKTATSTFDYNNISTQATDFTMQTAAGYDLNLVSGDDLEITATSTNITGRLAVTASSTQAFTVGDDLGYTLVVDTVNDDLWIGADASSTAPFYVDSSEASLRLATGIATTTHGADYLTSQNEYTLQTTSGNLILTSAALLDINAGADLDLDVTGNGTIDTSGTLTVNSVGNSSWTTTSGDLSVVTASSGDINVTSAEDIAMQAGTDMSLTYGNTFLLTDGTPRLEIDALGNIILGDTSATTTMDAYNYDINAAHNYTLTAVGNIDLAGVNYTLTTSGTYERLISGVASTTYLADITQTNLGSYTVDSTGQISLIQMRK